MSNVTSVLNQNKSQYVGEVLKAIAQQLVSAARSGGVKKS